MSKTTITAGSHHGIRQGDIVEILSEGRFRRLRMLFSRPRVKYAAEVTPTTITLDERRMTWAEWRAAVRSQVFGWVSL